MQFRQILRALGKTPTGRAKIREKLLKCRHRLLEREFWILEYIYYEKLSTYNVSDKLNLSTSHFHNVLNQALSKFETLITDAEMREIVEML
ncbi:MAG: hypothetical protein NC191_04710 [Muribaculaceae bacterium]|nr:hypothetical protein [Muribaculaceae bacterium]